MGCKAGIKTTEFWVSGVIVPIVVPLIMAGVDRLGLAIDENTITVLVVGIVTAPVAYIIGRVCIKVRQCGPISGVPNGECGQVVAEVVRYRGAGNAE